MCTVVQDIYNLNTVPHIQASIFNWTYLHSYLRYVDNSASVILKTWCRYSAHSSAYAVWTVVSDIYSVNTIPHILASIFNWTYLCRYWGHADICMRVKLQTLCQIQRTPSSSRYVYCGSGHIQCNYSSAYSVLNILLNVTALLFQISRLFNARYTANMLPNTAHILQITLCELWSRPHTV
jgi:hypothetical protein